MDLSIVVPTCNRADLLDRAITSIAATTRCRFEIIAVDGASTDATTHVLDFHKSVLCSRMQIVRETKREGFVRGANKGFRLAQGRHVCWINDDARVLPGALDRAVQQLDTGDETLGMVALFHRWHSLKNVAHASEYRGSTFSVCHVRGTLYANFPIIRRDLFERIGRLDERFVFCGADPDLSLAVWHAGYRVEPAWGSFVDHDMHEDDRRAEDHPQLQRDNAMLFAKWNLPPKSNINDFDPERPCTLRGLNPGIATNSMAA